MIITPQCFQCRHMVKGEGSFSCPAFDGEIPDAIVLNDHDHREPYPGDRGIRFEPRQPRSDDPMDTVDDDRPN